MTEITSFTLRIPTDLADALDARCPKGQSRTAYIVRVLEEHVGDFDPGLVLGYVELADGEVGPDSECPECHMPFGDKGVYIGFTADLKPFGPVCGICATIA